MEQKKMNLFEVLSERGYNVKEVAAKLHVKNSQMTVGDFMNRFMKGGLRHKFFQAIYDICLVLCSDSNCESVIVNSVA